MKITGSGVLSEVLASLKAEQAANVAAQNESKPIDAAENSIALDRHITRIASRLNHIALTFGTV